MTYRSLLLATAISLASTSALAAPVFMLQFGSFETKEEADSHLKDLTSKHAPEVGALSPGIREVTLPPDNLTVYRTQAGPVSTRAEAQSICGKLTGSGEHCYVVETAMMPSSATPMASAASSPAPMASAAPATPEPAATGELPRIATPTATVRPPAISAPENDVRDSSSMAMINGVMGGSPGFTGKPLSETPSAAPAAVDTRPMEAAMDDAAARQAAPAKLITAPAKESSFWDRMNPFSSDEEAAPAPAPIPMKVAQSADTEVAAPIDRVTTDNPPQAMLTPLQSGQAMAAETTAPVEARIEQKTAAVEQKVANVEQKTADTVNQTASSLPSPSLVTGPEEVPQPAAPLPSPALVTADASPTPVTVPQVQVTAPAAQAAPQPVAVDVAPIAMPASGSPMMLPPPPAPLRAQDQAALAAGQTPPSAPMIVRPQPTGALPGAAPMPASAPVPVAVEPAAPFRSGPSALPGGGETSAAPVAMQSAPVPATTVPAVPVGVDTQPVQALEPSATMGQKSLWAQISEFSSEQEALAFWDAYSHAHPDFPAVRVRVTQPLQQRGAAVSLRVGPFGRVESIRNLCGTMPVKKLRCGSVTDLGVAADPHSASGTLPDSRYQR